MNLYDQYEAPEEEEEIRTDPTLYDYIVGIFIFFGFIMAAIYLIITIFTKLGKIGGF